MPGIVLHSVVAEHSEHWKGEVSHRSLDRAAERTSRARRVDLRSSHHGEMRVHLAANHAGRQRAEIGHNADARDLRRGDMRRRTVARDFVSSSSSFSASRDIDLMLQRFPVLQRSGVLDSVMAKLSILVSGTSLALCASDIAKSSPRDKGDETTARSLKVGRKAGVGEVEQHAENPRGAGESSVVYEA